MSKDLQNFINIMATVTRDGVTKNNKPIKYHDLLKLLELANIDYDIEYGDSYNNYVEKDSLGHYKLVIYSKYLLENNRTMQLEYIKKYGKDKFIKKINKELNNLYNDTNNYIFENIILGIGVICLEEYLVDKKIPDEYKISFNQLDIDSSDRKALEYFKSIFTIPDKLFLKLIREHIKNYKNNEYLVSSTDIAKELKLTYETVNNRFKSIN